MSTLINARSATSISKTFARPLSVSHEIMVFPAGRHTIHATKRGGSISIDVQIDEHTAAVMNAALLGHMAASQQRPYFDFDHEEKAASAWPTSFYWKPDGVYASVEWSGAGQDAVSRKTYRAFSPTFFADDSTPARVVGAPFVMGGLVNNPAFREMAPLWASSARATIMHTITPSWVELAIGAVSMASYCSNRHEMKAKGSELGERAATLWIDFIEHGFPTAYADEVTKIFIQQNAT